MKKRWIAVLLILCCIMSLSENVAPVAYGAVTDDREFTTLKSELILMDILDASLTEENYSKKVKRKEFARLLVKASLYSETEEKTSGNAIYSDLSSKSTYAVYVKTAVDNQWMSGYLDGTFRPNERIKTKDAAKAVLGLLGYTDQDFSGNKVNARMTKFNSLGLNENIKKSKNETLTWTDVVYLMGNLMETKTKEGTLYGQSLGYTMDSDGEIDYNALLSDTMEGPLLAEAGWTAKLPVDSATARVYRNDKVSTWSELAMYDVLYYSERLNTIWSYDNKITGKVTAVSPNRINPETVTVAGAAYTLGTKEAINSFSVQGSCGENDIVTLFLGLNDTVAAVRDTTQYNGSIYGAVLEAGTRSSTSESSSAILEDYLVLLDSRGHSYTYSYDPDAYTIEEDTAVRVSFNALGEQKIETSITDGERLYGSTVNEDGTSAGIYPILPNASIIDVYQSKYETLSPRELAGLYLNGANLLYASFDAQGSIDEMILTGVSGCGSTYGLVTGLDEQMGGLYYTYVNETGTQSVNMDLTYGDIEEGSCYRIWQPDDSDTIYFNKLGAESVSILSSTYIKTPTYAGIPFNDVRVYYLDKEGDYYATTLSKISDLKSYRVTAYIDSETSMIRKVRFLVAEKIN